MIARDKKNGGYRVAVPYKDEFGVTKRKWRRCKTLKEAKQIEAKLTTDIKNYSRVANSMTLDELFNEMENDDKSKIRATTIYAQNLRYKRYIKNVLGSCPVNEINVPVLKKWKATIPSDQLTSSKRLIFLLLSKLFRYGKRVHGLTAIDALQVVGNFEKDPNAIHEEKKLHFWTPAQFAMFSEALRKKCECYKETETSYLTFWDTYVILNICFFAGLRIGEAAALFIKDYHKDVERPYLDITKSVTRRPIGDNKITKTKNEQSNRKVPIPKTLCAILDEHIERLRRLPCKFSEDLFLVSGEKPICQQTIRDIKNCIEKEKFIEHIRVHDLRHSYVSVLINAGVPITTISKLVGHTSVEVTWKVYSHLYPDTLSDAIDVFDQMMVSNKKSQKSVPKSVPLA